MHKIKVEITTDNGVLEAGKVLDIKRYLSPKEAKELMDAGYIEVYNEDVNSDDSDNRIKKLETEKKVLNTQIETLTTTNKELNDHVVKSNKTIVELETKIKELSKTTPSTKTATKPGTKK